MPTSILKLKFVDIHQVLKGLFETFSENAPMVRSCIQCQESLLFAQDTAMWTSESACKESFQELLLLCLDERPKVRKRAADGIKRITASPPPPALNHPGTVLTIEFCNSILEGYLASAGGMKFSKENNSQVLDILVFLKLMISVFAKQSRNEKVSARLDSLVRTLLSLPVKSSGSGDSILTKWVFEVLDSLLSVDQDEVLSFAVVESVVGALLEMSPHENDAVLTPAWLSLMQNGFARLADLVAEVELAPQTEDQTMDDADAKMVEFARTTYGQLVSAFFLRIFGTYFSSTATLKPVIVERASQVLIGLVEGVSNSMISAALESPKDSPLGAMLNVLEHSLGDIHYREKWGHLLQLCAAFFKVCLC
ncbi:hypothetical protein HDU91_003782 [Kappamyces sp. JEL0680]|nr:hypothetical protein HDU91_003782 [Kappamyces sp. JEL0680]